MKTIITFEDHGQDFLMWIIDENSKIIDCKPSQFSIWGGFTVMNDKLRVGDLVRIKKGKERLTIKYPVANIQLDNVTGLFSDNATEQ
jgi:hypothetical protein